MAVSVDRVSAAIIWTVQPLAPHSEGRLHHLRSDMDTLRQTHWAAVWNIDVERVERELYATLLFNLNIMSLLCV